MDIIPVTISVPTRNSLLLGGRRVSMLIRDLSYLASRYIRIVTECICARRPGPVYLQLVLPFRECCKVEEPPRLMNVLGDLIAQCVHGRKLDFIPQPLEEEDFNFRVDAQFNRMKVQQVRLNRKR